MKRHGPMSCLLCATMISVVAILTGGCNSRGGQASESVAPDWKMQRENMVSQQIEARGVKGPLVLESMRTVPRHLFVPENYRDSAYNDSPLPIGDSQTISQPYIVALMSELLEVQSGEKVLEIGTGSGYQAAVLASMGVEVRSIEIRERLCERAASTLSELGYESVRVRCADGYGGWPEEAPFDGIIVTAAPEWIPDPLLEQLQYGDSGGRLLSGAEGHHPHRGRFRRAFRDPGPFRPHDRRSRAARHSVALPRATLNSQFSILSS